MDCRSGCAACCTAPSISSPIPGMPQGKPAGVPCVQLDERLRCKLFGDPRRPAVCSSLKPSATMCGETREFALRYLAELAEQIPGAQHPDRLWLALSAYNLGMGHFRGARSIAKSMKRDPDVWFATEAEMPIPITPAVKPASRRGPSRKAG